MNGEGRQPIYYRLVISNPALPCKPPGGYIQRALRARRARRARRSRPTRRARRSRRARRTRRAKPVNVGASLVAATLVCDLSAGELPCVLAFLRDIVTGSGSCLYDPSATAIPCAFVGGDVENSAESSRRHGGMAAVVNFVWEVMQGCRSASGGTLSGGSGRFQR